MDPRPLRATLTWPANTRWAGPCRPTGPTGRSSAELPTASQTRSTTVADLSGISASQPIMGDFSTHT